MADYQRSLQALSRAPLARLAAEDALADARAVARDLERKLQALDDAG